MDATVWTSLIAVGGTLGSGTLGYVASREKSKTELNSVEVELEKLRQPAEETRRQARRVLYQRYLGIVAKFDPVLRSFVRTAMETDGTERTALRIDINSLGTELADTLGEIQVLASDEVAQAAEALSLQVSKVLNVVLEGLRKKIAEIEEGKQGGKSPSDTLEDVMVTHSWKPQRAALIATMKREIEL